MMMMMMMVVVVVVVMVVVMTMMVMMIVVLYPKGTITLYSGIRAVGVVVGRRDLFSSLLLT